MSPLDPKLIEEVEQVFREKPELLDTFLRDVTASLKHPDHKEEPNDDEA